MELEWLVSMQESVVVRMDTHTANVVVAAAAAAVDSAAVR